MAKLTETATSEESFWALREDNEWEGETWTVYFSAPEEHRKELKRLKRLLKDEGDESPYELRRVQEIPAHLLEDEDPEGDGDFEEDEESWADGYDDDFDDEEDECYHPAYSVHSLNAERLAEAIGYFEAGGSKTDDDDPLYKLGLFL